MIRSCQGKTQVSQRPTGTAPGVCCWLPWFRSAPYDPFSRPMPQQGQTSSCGTGSRSSPVVEFELPRRPRNSQYGVSGGAPPLRSRQFGEDRRMYRCGLHAVGCIALVSGPVRAAVAGPGWAALFSLVSSGKGAVRSFAILITSGRHGHSSARSPLSLDCGRRLHAPCDPARPAARGRLRFGPGPNRLPESGQTQLAGLRRQRTRLRVHAQPRALDCHATLGRGASRSLRPSPLSLLAPFPGPTDDHRPSVAKSFRHLSSWLRSSGGGDALRGAESGAGGRCGDCGGPRLVERPSAWHGVQRNDILAQAAWEEICGRQQWRRIFSAAAERREYETLEPATYGDSPCVGAGFRSKLSARVGPDLDLRGRGRPGKAAGHALSRMANCRLSPNLDLEKLQDEN